MCSEPQTKDGLTFACRRCNECLAGRRSDWVARGVAEATGWKHFFSLTLTYDDAVPQGYDGARMFCYSDVQDFMRRLRRAAHLAEIKAAEAKAEAQGAEFDPKSVTPPVIRFVVAGEQGDRHQRCHWHLLLYSDFDLYSLGQITRLKNGRRQVVTDRADFITVDANNAIRCHWSLWTVEQFKERVPLGFVTFQIADQEAVAYVMSYCLIDQFTEEKSRGTMREAKSKNFVTGLFRMSKRPAIGEEFVMRKLNGLAQKGAVLPNLKIKVPGLRHYWVPKGTLRKRLLEGLRDLNEQSRQLRGKDAPQWAALLASLSEDEKALEVLNGPQEDDESEEDFAAGILLRGKEAEHAQAVREHRRQCGAILPCTACIRHHAQNTPGFLETLGIEEFYEEQGWAPGWSFRSRPGFVSIGERQTTGGAGVNPYCLKRGSKISRQTFPRTDPNPPR